MGVVHVFQQHLSASFNVFQESMRKSFPCNNRWRRTYTPHAPPLTLDERRFLASLLRPQKSGISTICGFKRIASMCFLLGLASATERENALLWHTAYYQKPSELSDQPCLLQGRSESFRRFLKFHFLQSFWDSMREACI